MQLFDLIFPQRCNTNVPIIQISARTLDVANHMSVACKPALRSRRAQAAAWGMPLESVLDLVQLALYDTVIFVDDSGSMVFEEAGERIADLRFILGRVTEVRAQP